MSRYRVVKLEEVFVQLPGSIFAQADFDRDTGFAQLTNTFAVDARVRVADGDHSAADAGFD